uniref:Uncharacterized protein n=1 Tax=Rhodococcus sp. T104 TaxID=230533 RepID=B6VJH9_9NOCA|nr:hypothetical protein [Rhodococcus sp. T104]
MSAAPKSQACTFISAGEGHRGRLQGKIRMVKAGNGFGPRCDAPGARPKARAMSHQRRSQRQRDSLRQPDHGADEQVVTAADAVSISTESMRGARAPASRLHCRAQAADGS